MSHALTVTQPAAEMYSSDHTKILVKKIVAYASIVGSKVAVLGKMASVIAMHHPVGLGIAAATVCVVVPTYKFVKRRLFLRDMQVLLDREYGLAVDHLEDDFGTMVGPFEVRTWRDTYHRCVSNTAEMFGNLRGVLGALSCCDGREMSAHDCTTMVVWSRARSEANARVVTNPVIGVGSPIIHSDAQLSPPMAVSTTGIIRGCGLIITAPIEIARHRKVRRGHRKMYSNCVIKECKLRFGVPSRNDANRKAIGRFADSIMAKHGLRPSHAAAALPSIVAATFMPSRAERQSARILASSHAKGLIKKYDGHLKRAGFKDTA